MLLLLWLWKRYPHQLALPRCSKVAFHQWSSWQLSVGRMSRHLLNSSQVMLEDTRARAGPTDTFCLPGDYPNISLLSISSFFLGCVFFWFLFSFLFSSSWTFWTLSFLCCGSHATKLFTFGEQFSLHALSLWFPECGHAAIQRILIQSASGHSESAIETEENAMKSKHIF